MSIKVASLVAGMLICNKTQVHEVEFSEFYNIDLELEKAMAIKFERMCKSGNRNTVVIFHDKAANQIRAIGVKHVTLGVNRLFTDLHSSIAGNGFNAKAKGAVKTFHTQLTKYLPTGRFLKLKDKVVQVERSPKDCAAALSQAEHLTLVMGVDGNVMVFEHEYLYAIDDKKVICLDWES